MNTLCLKKKDIFKICVLILKKLLRTSQAVPPYYKAVFVFSMINGFASAFTEILSFIRSNAAIVSDKIRIFFIPQFHDLVLIILRIFCRKLLKPFLDKSGVFDRFIIILYIGKCEYLLCLSALLTIELTHFSLPHCNISATEYNLSFL